MTCRKRPGHKRVLRRVVDDLQYRPTYRHRVFEAKKGPVDSMGSTHSVQNNRKKKGNTSTREISVSDTIVSKKKEPLFEPGERSFLLEANFSRGVHITLGKGGQRFRKTFEILPSQGKHFNLPERGDLFSQWKAGHKKEKIHPK